MPGAMLLVSVGSRGMDRWKYWLAGGKSRMLRITCVTLRMKSVLV